MQLYVLRLVFLKVDFLYIDLNYSFLPRSLWYLMLYIFRKKRKLRNYEKLPKKE